MCLQRFCEINLIVEQVIVTFLFSTVGILIIQIDRINISVSVVIMCQFFTARRVYHAILISKFYKSESI